MEVFVLGEGLTKQERIFQTLVLEIEKGIWPVDSLLPSGARLAERFDVAPLTVRRVLLELQNQHYIRTVNGVGSFVLPRPQENEPKILVVTTPTFTQESCLLYIISGIMESCQERKVKVDFLLESFLRGDDRIAFARNLRRKNYLGVIFTRCLFVGDEPEFAALRELNIPVLLPHATPEDRKMTGFATLFTDEAAAWEDALVYLRELGHRRIAQLMRPLHTGRFRSRTWVQHQNLLKKLGLDASPDLFCILNDYNSPDFVPQLTGLLQKPERPTAILGFSDFFALRACDELARLRIGVPDELSVMGFCGYPGGESRACPLSTMDFMYGRIGDQAVRTLLHASEWFGGGKKVPLLKTPYRLVERSTTGLCHGT